MNPKTKAEFDILLQQKGNNKCIDCNTYNPQWASVSHGTFLCIRCAGTHRSLGVHLSFVRSVTMDTWSPLQLARMKCGGNAQMRKYWKDENFPSDLGAEEKYDNDAMEEYREWVKSRAQGNSSARKPSGIGYTPRRQIPKKNSVQSMSSDSSRAPSRGGVRSYEGFGGGAPAPSTSEVDEMWNALGNYAQTFASKTVEISSQVAAKTKVAAVNLGNTASEKATSMKTQMESEDFGKNLSETATKGWSAFSGFISQASQSVASFVEEKVGPDEPLKFYNESTREKKQSKFASQAISSDQYFGGFDDDGEVHEEPPEKPSRKTKRNNRRESSPQNELSDGDFGWPSDDDEDNDEVEGSNDEVDFDDFLGFGDEDVSKKKKKKKEVRVKKGMSLKKKSKNENGKEKTLPSESTMQTQEEIDDELNRFFAEDDTSSSSKKKKKKTESSDVSGKNNVEDDGDDFWGW